MKFAKVEFPSDQDAGTARVGLMRRGRVTCLRNGTFILPWPALEWLQENKIPHNVLQQLSQDNVTQTLRDLLVHQA
jgi:hypothetical protein